MRSSGAKPYHPIKGMDETDDMLLGTITAMAAQLAAMRERIDTLERLLEARGLPGAQDIEAFEPDEEAIKQRDVLRQRLIARIFSPIEQSVARSAEAKETKP